MKKIFYTLAVAALTLGFSSCKETWDENPVLKSHEGTLTENFLNEPILKSQPITLTQDNKDGAFHLTCSQPDFGYAAVATYKVQVSLTEDFKEYKEIAQAFYNCAEINPVNGDIASAIETLSGVKSEDDLPLPYQRLYMRLHCYLAQSPDNTDYLSNVVSFDKVSADYLAVWVADVPVNIYLRGSLPLSDWGTVPEYQFVTGPVENTWVIKNVQIPGGSQFKVADPGWGAINYGGPGSIIPGEEYQLEYNGGNIGITKDFDGLVQLRLEAGVYYLLLDPKTE